MRAALVALALLPPSGLAAQTPLEIQAVNAPLAYFAERLAGDAAAVTLPVPTGADPAAWKPGMAELAALQEADLILLNGADYAPWTARVSLPRARTVDTSRAFAEDYIAVEGVTHSHGDTAEHSHAATASFTWLDFQQAGFQAEAVAAALARALPEAAPVIEAEGAALKADLAALDAEGQRIGAALDGRALLAFHPGYEYLARRYGLNLRHVTWDPNAAPDADQLAELDAVLAEDPADLMLWEAPPGPEAAAELSARGVEPVIFSQGATVPAAEFLALMTEGLAALDRAAASASN